MYTSDILPDGSSARHESASADAPRRGGVHAYRRICDGDVGRNRGAGFRAAHDGCVRVARAYRDRGPSVDRRGANCGRDRAPSARTEPVIKVTASAAARMRLIVFSRKSSSPDCGVTIVERS
jgi:hypothetical protein